MRMFARDRALYRNLQMNDEAGGRRIGGGY